MNAYNPQKIPMQLRTSSQWDTGYLDNPYNEDIYGLNLIQTPQSSYLDKVQTKGTITGAMTGNPGLAAAGLVTDLIGTGLSAYGTYEQNQAIEAQNELAKEMFNEERERSREKDRMARQAAMLARDFDYGNYARSEQDDVLNDFGGYASRVGL